MRIETRYFLLMRAWKIHLKTVYWLGAIGVVLVGLAAALVLNRIHRHDQLILRISKEQGVDPHLVSAVIWRESRFNPAAVGKAGEIGLMQVTEMVGHEWAFHAQRESFTLHDLYNPEINIRAGTWYLNRALTDWSDRADPVPYALAQYNAGRSNALRWSKNDEGDARQFIAQISYPMTQSYVETILLRYRGRL